MERGKYLLIILNLFHPVLHLHLCIARNMNPMCHTLSYYSLLPLACGGMLSFGMSCLALISLLVDRSFLLSNDGLKLTVDEVTFWQHQNLGFNQAFVWWNLVCIFLGGGTCQRL